VVSQRGAEPLKGAGAFDTASQPSKALTLAVVMAAAKTITIILAHSILFNILFFIFPLLSN
jgi:hypothetical protein